ncbi:hypothetical protein EVAR_78557_1 [Eumeta japonica]|uniref:Uncharacterized protein n=1 Tax=Eumeta variegata TaxID=151549 RepID=A0A4C1W9P3_EUMVA|nr:hypothetical protein EVAR_78557_1 [Eumeta japonica]
MEKNPDRFSVIARSRKQVARPHASRARCDRPINARRSPSSRHLAPINAHASEMASAETAKFCNYLRQRLTSRAGTTLAEFRACGRRG